MKTADLLEYLKETSTEMTRGNIDEAMLLHFDLIMESYRGKPFFYKNLLKYDRFMIALSLIGFGYKDEQVPLSEVKAFCQKRGYMSRNSLDAYFSFLVVSGYMNVQLHVQDGRLRCFQPTDKTLRDATPIIKSYLLPSQMILPYDSWFPSLATSVDLLELFMKGSYWPKVNGTTDRFWPKAAAFCVIRRSHQKQIAASSYVCTTTRRVKCLSSWVLENQPAHGTSWSSSRAVSSTPSSLSWWIARAMSRCLPLRSSDRSSSRVLTLVKVS